MRMICPNCGKFFPENITHCPCGVPLVEDPTQPPEEGEPWSGGRRLILAIAALAVVGLTLFLAFGLGKGQSPPLEGSWESRSLEGARIRVEAPDPFNPVPLSVLQVPKEVEAGVARADLFVARGLGYHVLAGRLLSARRESLPPAPRTDGESPASEGTVVSHFFLPVPTSSKGAEIVGPEGVTAREASCFAGRIGGLAMDARMKVEGHPARVRTFVLAEPPEMWLITVRNLVDDPAAEAAAQRIVDTLSIDGEPLVVLRPAEHDLTGTWRDFTLVPGALSISAPAPWQELDVNSVAPSAHLPCSSGGARFFYCLFGQASVIVATGSCAQDLEGYAEKALKGEIDTANPQEKRSPAILVGRRAVAFSRDVWSGETRRTELKVVATAGFRAWVLNANFPAEERASRELVERIQRSMKEE